MTDEDKELDPSGLMRDSTLKLFRYTRKRYANLAGIGSASAPGRWNLPAQRALYTSTEQGVPILERLVHTPKDEIPLNLAMMEIELSGDWVLTEDGLLDRHTGASVLVYTTLRKARRSFEDSRRSLLMGLEPPFKTALGFAAPSVIVPVWNVVLFPRGVGFRNHVRLKQVTSLELDTRLFPEEALIEEPL